MQIASEARFGPELYGAGLCEDVTDPHFWQAIEPFDDNLDSYLIRFSPCSGEQLGDLELSLRNLFAKMAEVRMFCMDLKLSNVVVQFDKEDGVIHKMRLIDFDDVFCLRRVEDQSVSVNTLWLSMLMIFSSNTYIQCGTMFFRTFLNDVFSRADGKVVFSEVVSFLTVAETSEFTVRALMKHYYVHFAAAREKARPADVRSMVEDVLRDERAHQAPAPQATQLKRSPDTTGSAKASARGSAKSSARGSAKASARGSAEASARGPAKASARGSAKPSARGPGKARQASRKITSRASRVKPPSTRTSQGSRKARTDRSVAKQGTVPARLHQRNTRRLTRTRDGRWRRAQPQR